MLEKRRRQRIKERFITAVDLGKKKCIKCGCCCNLRPCIPTFDEFIKIAEFLNLAPNEAKNKFFCIDTNDGKIYFLKPAGVNQKDLLGNYIPNHRTFGEGKCVFLNDDNLCEIYSVRPIEARECCCWKEKRFTEFNPNVERIKTWKGKIKFSEEEGWIIK
jgi:Fe-S-cluster containining protein